MKINGVMIPEHATVQGTPNFSLAVPSDSTVLSDVRGIVCLTAGNLVAKNAAGTSVTIAMIVGQKLDISPIAIMAATTGTYLLLQS